MPIQSDGGNASMLAAVTEEDTTSRLLTWGSGWGSGHLHGFSRFCVADPGFNCVIKSEGVQPNNGERGQLWSIICYNMLEMLEMFRIPMYFLQLHIAKAAESFTQILTSAILLDPGGRRYYHPLGVLQNCSLTEDVWRSIDIALKY